MNLCRRLAGRQSGLMPILGFLGRHPIITCRYDHDSNRSPGASRVAGPTDAWASRGEKHVITPWKAGNEMTKTSLNAPATKRIGDTTYKKGNNRADHKRRLPFHDTGLTALLCLQRFDARSDGIPEVRNRRSQTVLQPCRRRPAEPLPSTRNVRPAPYRVIHGKLAMDQACS